MAEPKFSGGLVPAIGPDGALKWQSWTYAELVDHLQQDLIVPFGYDSAQIGAALRSALVWHDLPLNGTNWQHWGTGLPHVSYALDALGFVHLQGVYSSVAAYSSAVPSTLVIGTLPAGFRPPTNQEQIFWTIQQTTTPNNVIIRFDVATNGAVELAPLGASDWALNNGGNNGNVVFGSLGHVMFPQGN